MSFPDKLKMFRKPCLPCHYLWVLLLSIICNGMSVTLYKQGKKKGVIIFLNHEWPRSPINHWLYAGAVDYHLDGGVVLFSRSIVSNSLQLCGLQHARLPCPSLSTRACSNSCALSQWCHPAISTSVIPFSSCLQSFPESGSFQMSQLFQMANVLEFQLQHQSFQLTLRTHFL